MSTMEPMPDGVSLEGGEWLVVEHLDASGDLVPIAEGIHATAPFADGRVAGSTGCNRYTGMYEAGEGTLTIGQVATTKMACLPEADAVERSVLAALDATAGYAIDDEGLLSLTDTHGSVVLRLEASRLGLIGTEWGAIMINNGREAVTSLVAGTTASARFAADGQLSGFGGCNRVFGPCEVDGESIRIGPVASTRMACAEPEGVIAGERVSRRTPAGGPVADPRRPAGAA
jgi:heat shock protein HslJ